VRRIRVCREFVRAIARRRRCGTGNRPTDFQWTKTSLYLAGALSQRGDTIDT